MNILRKKIGPVFLKENSSTDSFIDKMEALKAGADNELKNEIEKQIKLAKYGQAGENNVSFELKNSGIDMYILHDIFLEKENMQAQIDYIVVTRKHTYVIECKNLIGDIEINNRGDFIRSYNLFGKKVHEGIYSPITQNQRHIQVLKEIRLSEKTNIISKMMFEKYFDDNYKSIVVLANPRTCLNARYAPKDIKKQVIRADQLISYIKEMDEKQKDFKMSDNDMKKLAMFYLERNQAGHSDYSKKYEDIQKRANIPINIKNDDIHEEKTTEKDGIIERLKNFRLEQSRKEKIKPYYIFSNEQMNRLVEEAPRTKDELIRINGFGRVKADKYGDAILKCLWE